MAEVPNAYYESPWIKDAARNLASALAPADPEKTLAAQRDQWRFERDQQLAQMQDEERARELHAREAVPRLLLGNYDKPGEAGTGAGDMGFGQWMQASQPEHLATRDDAAYNADLQAATAGLPLGEAFMLMGENDPKFRQQLALRKAGYDSQGNLLDRRLDSNEYIANNRNRSAEDRSNDVTARMLAMAEDDRAFRADQARLDRESRERNARIRDSTGASGNPKQKISPAQRDVLRKSVLRKYTVNGVTPPPEEVDAITKRALEYYEEGYNDAPDLAFAEFHGNKEPNPGDPHKWNPVTAAVPPSWALRDDMGLGDVVTMLPRLGREPEPLAAPGSRPPQRVRVNSPDEARRLPPNTPFVTPDGRTGTTRAR